MHLIKNIIFDRDGTLIKHVPYLHKVDQVELLPSVKESLKLLKQNNFRFFLHTNQSGVGRGYYQLMDVVSCNERMIELIGLGENLFESICIAPEAPDSEIIYRKPSPKFGLSVMNKYEVEKRSLVYIGDSICDLETAKNLGCQAIAVQTGLQTIDREVIAEKGINAIYFNSMMEVALFLISPGSSSDEYPNISNC